MTTDTSRAITWNHGVVSVNSLGGMLGPILFILPDGRQVAPFQVAPWANETFGDEIPNVLRRLRGEWPCVPFGADANRPALGEWPGSTAERTVDSLPHGFGSNNHWTFGDASPTDISLSIDYPEPHPIRSLKRSVMPDPESAALDCELVINVRSDCTLPIGLHPTFRLPERPGAVRIEVGDEISGMTYPHDVDASSIFRRHQVAAPWHDVRLRDGSTLDISAVPLRQKTEDLVQLLEMPGHAALWNAEEGYRARLVWNQEHFPSALLWFSNHGRSFEPWNGRHLALGLEPICSAFDLGAQISASDNPINRRGVATARSFTAGERFVTRYRVEVEAAPYG